MSKKLFFIVISAVFMFLGCGSNDSCATTHSYGVNSLTRKESAEICYEKIAGSSCYSNYSSEQVESIIHGWQDKKFVFHKDSCKDSKNLDKAVECPDFIPDFFKFSTLEGCEIYTIDPDTKCDAPCYDLYFSTNDRYFPKAFFQEFGEKYINSVSSDGLAKFSSTIELNGSTSASFFWSEKTEDGTETEKAVSVEMKVVDSDDYTGEDFEAVDVGECRHEEPAFALRDRIYTETDSYWCKEYVEVTDKTENSIRFNWFGEMHCGADWEYGYKIEGIVENVLKVNILERDTDEIAVDCDNCCYLMPIEYTASTAEEIESLKGIEINYEGKNHTAYFEIK